MWSLIESIHSKHTQPDNKSMDRVRWAFEQAWPELEAGLKAIKLENGDANDRQDESEEESLIRDVLQEVKGISIAVAALSRQYELDLDQIESAPAHVWNTRDMVSVV